MLDPRRCKVEAGPGVQVELQKMGQPAVEMLKAPLTC